MSRPRVWHCKYLRGGGISSFAFLPVIAAPNVFAPAAGPHGCFVACRTLLLFHTRSCCEPPSPTFLYSPLLLATVGEFHLRRVAGNLRRGDQGRWQPHMFPSPCRVHKRLPTARSGDPVGPPGRVRVPQRLSVEGFPPGPFEVQRSEV